MEITKKFYAKNRKEWRNWLIKNSQKEKEIWLVYYRKSSSKPRIPYDDAVEEALCFGWIDSTVKGIDDEKFAQRFTPRRKNSYLSQLNKERIRKLIRTKKMTKQGLQAVSHAFDHEKEKKEKLHLKPLKIDSEILKELKKDKQTWENFEKFPLSYKRVRIFWIQDAKDRPEVFKKRLSYFLKMTAKNKMYGTIVN